MVGTVGTMGRKYAGNTRDIGRTALQELSMNTPRLVQEAPLTGPRPGLLRRPSPPLAPGGFVPRPTGGRNRGN